MATYENYQRTITTDPGGGSGFIPGQAPTSGLQPVGLMVLRKPFSAGGGPADDVTVFSGLPEQVRFIDAFCIFTTPVNTETVTLRTASGGAGAPISSAMASGMGASSARNVPVAASPLLAAGSSIYARRSNSGLAGEVVLLLMPEYTG